LQLYRKQTQLTDDMLMLIRIYCRRILHISLLFGHHYLGTSCHCLFKIIYQNSKLYRYWPPCVDWKKLKLQNQIRNLPNLERQTHVTKCATTAYADNKVHGNMLQNICTFKDTWHYKTITQIDKNEYQLQAFSNYNKVNEANNENMIIIV
jgi:hypothetical protein